MKHPFARTCIRISFFLTLLLLFPLFSLPGNTAPNETNDSKQVQNKRNGNEHGSTGKKREIVVALRSTKNELRVVTRDRTNPSWTEEPVWDLPTRIEAIDLGDVSGDGRSDIVIGLAGNNGPDHVRAYTFDPEKEDWREIRISPTLPLHVEDVVVGDVDQDGTNEVVAALERVAHDEPTDVPRIRLYDRSNGDWREQNVSRPEAWSVQDVALVDPDGDGTNEIAALMANVLDDEEKKSEVRFYDRSEDGSWHITSRTPTYTETYRRAERMVPMEVSGDERDRIITAFWGPSRSRGKLVSYRLEDGELLETVVDGNTGLVDSLDVGDVNRNGRPDIVAGVHAMSRDNQIMAFERRGDESWSTFPISEKRPFGGTMIWDVGTGDVTGHSDPEIIAALNERLLLFRREGGDQFTGTLIQSYSVYLDSAQIGNVVPD